MSLGIYIQVPFCQTKCTYCNFHTGVFAKSIYSPYADAVCGEMEGSRALLGLPVDTVYLGGGTPSLLDAPDLARILKTLRDKYLCAWEEVTLEADPETIAPGSATAWRDSGINRVSLGVQSFDDTELRSAARMHRRADVYSAVETLRSAGFTNISLDLIAGLPHQTRTTWEDSLARIVEIRPEHVSIYLLEVDDGSRLGKEVLNGGTRYAANAVPSDDAMAEFYELASARLGSAGYEHYEISNWALPEMQSRHNLKYWRREPYLGFGAGAHSFDGHKRWSNMHDPAGYMEALAQGAPAIDQEEEVSAKHALEEELFLGLRQIAGVDMARIERVHGSSLSPRVDKLVREGMLERDANWVRLNPAKLTIANEAFVEVLG